MKPSFRYPKQILFFLSLLLIAFQGLSQNKESKPFVLGHIDQIRSALLSEVRTLNIYLPDGYSPDSAKTYPVIYLLDGSADEDFIHICGLVQFSSFPWVNRLPPSIVVGIANINRKRDFTYRPADTFKFPPELASYQKSYSDAGGSDKFIAFLEKELEPYIDQHYKTNASRTLIGQSLGGLLAAEILLKKPALFTNYLIVSPSFWWDDESLLHNAEAAIKSFPKTKMNVYVAVGNEGNRMREADNRLVELLNTNGPPSLRADFEYFPKEDHGTILHLAVANGFRLWYAK
jgi:predicted alpha/beta superfamily hydrolase